MFVLCATEVQACLWPIRNRSFKRHSVSTCYGSLQGQSSKKAGKGAIKDFRLLPAQRCRRAKRPRQMCLWAKIMYWNKLHVHLLSFNLLHTTCSLQISLCAFNFHLLPLGSSGFSPGSVSHLSLPLVNTVLFNIRASSLLLSMYHSVLTGIKTVCGWTEPSVGQDFNKYKMHTLTLHN